MIFTNAFSSSLHLDMKKYWYIIEEGEDPLNWQIWWDLTPQNPQNLETHSCCKQYQPIWSLGFPVPPLTICSGARITDLPSLGFQPRFQAGDGWSHFCQHLRPQLQDLHTLSKGYVTKGTCDCKHRLSIF